MRTADIIRRYIDVFQGDDRDAVGELLSDDLLFSSPLDVRIDKAAYFERCWANRHMVRILEIEKLFEEGEEAFIRYRAQRTEDKGTFRNTEFIRCREGKITEVQVYFGADD